MQELRVLKTVSAFGGSPRRGECFERGINGPIPDSVDHHLEAVLVGALHQAIELALLVVEFA
jgi:hypothetical protein